MVFGLGIREDYPGVRSLIKILSRVEGGCGVLALVRLPFL